ncbi:MAG TPA: hypothetical protein VKF32_13010 [Thermoanaerobaculia bacterium]|nr:hypothetical protein [Thermoanaerobaculia bacterium]
MSRVAAVFLATLVAFASLTRGVVFLAGNDASRFAHIQSLVEDRTPSIDGSQYAWTVDRVQIGGRLYSNKPPLLGIAGALLYAPLHAAGLSLRDASDRGLVLWLLTVVLSALPTAWLAAEFFRALELHAGIGTRVRLLVTAALVFGTTVAAYSVTLNGHTLAAALLFAAFHAAVRGHAARCGLLAGLAVSVDTVPALGLVPALAWIVGAGFGRRPLGRLLAGFSAASLLFFAANLATVGSLWPPKLAFGARDWTQVVGLLAARTQIVPGHDLYLLPGLFGWQGLLTTSPILVFGLAGLVRAIRRPVVLRRDWCLAVALAVAVQVIGRCSFPALAGGWSYGFRYLVPVIPFLMFFAPAALGGARTVAFTALFPISAAIALLGVYNPWPPVRENVSIQDPVIEHVRSPIGANAAALLTQLFPGSRAAEAAGSAFLDPDASARRKYLAYFYASRGDVERCRLYDPAVAAALQ